MSHRIAVVYEADADFRTGTELADRVLVEAIEWLDADLITHQREWTGEIGQERLTWKTNPRARAHRREPAGGRRGRGTPSHLVSESGVRRPQRDRIAP